MIVKKYVLMLEENGRWYPVLVDDSFSEYTALVMGRVCSYFETENVALKTRERLKYGGLYRIATIYMELR